MKRIMITGGAGFIGSALIRQFLKETDYKILNYDLLTYAGNLSSLPHTSQYSNYHFVHADICDRSRVINVLNEFKPDAIIHLAAETHVDRSINKPSTFIQTNVIGTSILLEESTNYWCNLPTEKRNAFRFLHVSTDEVYGSLGANGYFKETTPYDPRSPYSASKASSDHFVKAWHHTYKLPVLITNCSNNYGPFQFPEKLIPLMILSALELKSLPVYGDGSNVRDWIYVDDHARALRLVLDRGVCGETYNIGGYNEYTNLEIVENICTELDNIKPRKDKQQYRNLITFVGDRPGHDQRYAIDATKITTEIGWRPDKNFITGLRDTVQWYIDNSWWWQHTLLKND